MRIAALVAALGLCAATLPAQSLPRAIVADPPHDAQHPARMEVLHVPSGGVKINGLAYLASGAGAHPTFVLFHGLPGNEKNLDLLQAVRRAGWNGITINYRGSWGSPGEFRFAQTIEDAQALLAFLRDPANARALQVDTTRLVIAGHSMGGWAAAQVASRDSGLRGVVLISAADMGRYGAAKRPDVVKGMADNMESLAGTSAEQMADELIANGDRWRFERAVDGLARTPMLVLTSNDGLAAMADGLAAAVRARGNGRVTTQHVATDHGWSDRRLALQAAVLRWLDGLRR